MITERQQEFIDECKDNGYGWAMFASSVEESGNCSPKQEATLISMLCRISTAKINKAQRKSKGYGHPGYDNISDNEAMRSGDYF